MLIQFVSAAATFTCVSVRICIGIDVVRTSQRNVNSPGLLDPLATAHRMDWSTGQRYLLLIVGVVVAATLDSHGRLHSCMVLARQGIETLPRSRESLILADVHLFQIFTVHYNRNCTCLGHRWRGQGRCSRRRPRGGEHGGCRGQSLVGFQSDRLTLEESFLVARQHLHLSILVARRQGSQKHRTERQCRMHA